MGLPLAGKSSWVAAQPEFKDALVVSADTIKENLPGYDPEKAEEVHEDSVKLAEEEMYKAIDRGIRHIVMDGGGINDNYTVRIINRLRNSNYIVQLVHINTPIEVCLIRNRRRKRKVPELEIFKKEAREGAQFLRLKGLVNTVKVVNYFVDKHFFIDMDGVTTSYTPLTPINDSIDFVNNNYFEIAEPVMPTIKILKYLHEKGMKIHILSAIPNSFSYEQKQKWLDKYLPFIKKEDRFFVNAGRHKAEMLEGLVWKFDLQPHEVTMVEDTHSIILKVKEKGYRAIHVSELLANYYKYV